MTRKSNIASGRMAREAELWRRVRALDEHVLGRPKKSGVRLIRSGRGGWQRETEEKIMTSDIKTGHDIISARKSLIAELEAVRAARVFQHTIQLEAGDVELTNIDLALLAILIKYGGSLSISSDRKGLAHDFFLRVHGLFGTGATLEDIMTNWLTTAKTSLDEDLDP